MCNKSQLSNVQNGWISTKLKKVKNELYMLISSGEESVSSYKNLFVYFF